MIYFGVQILHQTFQIVALSQGFALIDQRCFSVEDYDQIEPWSDSLKIDPHESAQWFFDEQEFNNSDNHGFIFESLDPCNSIHLINHRNLSNVVQFFREWIAREVDFAPRPETAFFLASAIRIFDAQQIKHLIPDPEPF